MRPASHRWMRAACLLSIACSATPSEKDTPTPALTESPTHSSAIGDTAPTPGTTTESDTGPPAETAHTGDTAHVDSGTTHDTASLDTAPAPVEICGNGLDDDLDRLQDCDDPDCACTDACWADGPTAHANLLTNGSFDSLPEPIVGPVPDLTGVWQGDPSERTESGLPDPFDGSHTLRFIATGEPGIDDGRADLFQVLDATEYRGSHLCIAAAVGRTPGTIERSLSLTAWAAFGLPEDAPALFEEIASLDCEVDPRCGHRETATIEDGWTAITAPLHVPAAIGGVTILVQLSLRDVYGVPHDELGGHLADAITLFEF